MLKDQNGFVIIRRLLHDADFSELRANVDRHVRDIVPTFPDSEAYCHDRAQPETLKQLPRMAAILVFRDYMRHTKWTELTKLSSANQ